jgi:cell division protein FtsQ
VPVTERLTRFAAVYPQTLGQLKRRLDYVDLRYPNGFALRVPEILNPDSDRKAARKRA